ncbi:MAG: SMP-30/gluconolactonase/LRE family protein [Clostridiales bacterium]|nr:SMP-30/gluconolactonase/LRE family protein [Clostridiales bacterium]
MSYLPPLPAGRRPGVGRCLGGPLLHRHPVKPAPRLRYRHRQPACDPAEPESGLLCPSAGRRVCAGHERGGVHPQRRWAAHGQAGKSPVERHGARQRRQMRPGWAFLVRYLRRGGRRLRRRAVCDHPGRTLCPAAQRPALRQRAGLFGSTVYFIDSPRRQVQRYSFDPETLTLSGGEPVIVIDPAHGLPDGMTMDQEGMLWVAHWGGGFVGRYDPATGQLLAKVEVPASQTTSCCFGGKDMRTLFITTASIGKEEEPDAGKIFTVRLPVSGVESWRFLG